MAFQPDQKKNRRVITNRDLYHLILGTMRELAAQCMAAGGRSPVAEDSPFPTRQDDPGFESAETRYGAPLHEELTQ